MEYLRGDIFFVRKAIAEGSEQDAGRPAVIVSNNIGNEHANIVEVVYLTTQEKKPLPTHCDVMCKVPSIALCEQVCTVSKDRLVELIRTCTDAEMHEIDKALTVSLGLTGFVSETEHDLAVKVHNLKSELDSARKQICDLTEKESEPKEDVNVAVNYATILGERNTYKTMYEQLLELVMSQKGC